MSDAITDIGRDEERNEQYVDYLLAILAYLKRPVREAFQELSSTAKKVDGVRGGFWSGRETRFAITLPRFLHLLHDNDISTWVTLLLSAEDVAEKHIHIRSSERVWRVRSLYDELKALSPFAGKYLMRVDYSCRGTGRFSGMDLERHCGQIIESSGHSACAPHKYLIVLSGDNEAPEVISL